MVPAPLYSHQSIVTHLAFRISVFLEQNPLGIVCVAPRDVKLAADVNVQPDILFIAKERLGINRPQYVDGAPDLIVEVLSRGTMGRDMREKFAYYEQYGVKEYWILSPEDVFASEFYHLESGRYQPFYPAQSKLYSHVLAGFVLDLNQLEKALHPFD